MTTLSPELTDILGRFDIIWPRDELARDPQIIHAECGAVVCGVEQDDTLDALVRTALGHECGSYPHRWDTANRECAECGATDADEPCPSHPDYRDEWTS